MKIKTYIAKDMRQALRQIREEQGPEAVILSTRSVPGGVEVAAAVDPEQLNAPDLRPSPRRPPLAVVADEPQPAPVAVMAPVALPAAAAAPVPVSFAALMPAPAPVAPVVHPDDPPRAELGAELRSMRHMLETQLAQLAWNDLTRRAPAQAELLKELTELGLSQDLAVELVGEVPTHLAFEEAQRRALALIARRISVTGDVLLENGGRMAFVGPTGVGKTTAIAKIAARWVMRHGARDIALVSIDTLRFGAQEQLKTLGRLLGIEAFTLESPTELPKLLARLTDRRLVLVDTAGLSPRDPTLHVHAREVNDCVESASLQVCLTVSAAAQAGVLEEAVAKFAPFRPTTLMITKLDEATSLGGTLSLLMRTDLPVSYVSEGQRIPEDLSPARAHQIVSRAVLLARSAGALAGEDLLTRRFGGVAHGFA